MPHPRTAPAYNAWLSFAQRVAQNRPVATGQRQRHAPCCNLRHRCSSPKTNPRLRAWGSARRSQKSKRSPPRHGRVPERNVKLKTRWHRVWAASVFETCRMQFLNYPERVPPSENGAATRASDGDESQSRRIVVSRKTTWQSSRLARRRPTLQRDPGFRFAASWLNRFRLTRASMEPRSGSGRRSSENSHKPR